MKGTSIVSKARLYDAPKYPRSDKYHTSSTIFLETFGPNGMV